MFCGLPRYVTSFLVRQQERNWSVAHEEDAPARSSLASRGKQFVP